MTKISLSEKISFGYKLLNREDYEDQIERTVKEVFKRLMQESIVHEFNEKIKASPYERTKDRTCYRNGYYIRNFILKNYVIEGLKIPRARNMRIEYTAFKKWQRISNEFKERVIEYILAGNSFQTIVELVTEKFPKISKQTVSNILKELKEEQEYFNKAPIKDDIVVLYIDGIYKKVKGQKLTVLIAMGINKKGNKKILGYEVGKKRESESLCYRLLNKLRHRGLKGNKLKIIVRDGNKAIRNAAYDIYPFAKQQNCLVHVKRNILKRLKRRNWKRFMGDIRELFEANKISEYYKILNRLEKKYKGMEDKAIKYIKTIEEESLTYLEFDKELRKIITSNNYIERYMRKINTFLNRRNSFESISSLEMFMFLVAYKYNLQGISLTGDNKEAFKKFTQFS